MKRALRLLPAVLVLVACVWGQSPEVTPTPVPSATPAPPTSTPLPPDATTAARIRARGHLIVGVRYDLQPFGFVTDAGEVAGFDPDLGRELARRWLGDASAVRFLQVRSDTAVERLQDGSVDLIIAALAHRQDTEAGADFSLPYFMDGQALLVRAADAGVIRGPENLAGLLVGVIEWGDAELALRSAVPFTLTLQTYDRFNSAVGALERGEVDAVADERHRLFWGARLLPEATVVGQYTKVPLALAFAQNDPFIADLVNLTLQSMLDDGGMAELHGRWFGEEPLPEIERWPGPAAVPGIADAAIVTHVPDAISAIQSRGRVVVALAPDRPPFAYVDASGALAGYEVNLVRLLATSWVGDPTAVDFIPGSVEMGMELLRTGGADIMVGGLAHTRSAELELDFSRTIYVGGEGLMVQAGTPVTDLTSLQGQQVAVLTGSPSGDVLLAAAQGMGLSLTVLPQPTMEAAIVSLQAGQVAAVAAERCELLGPAYATPGVGVLPVRLTRVPLALGLPPGDSAFRDLVNLTLQAFKVDGQFDALYGVWFDDAAPEMPVWPGAPYRTLHLEVTAPPAEG